MVAEIFGQTTKAIFNQTIGEILEIFEEIREDTTLEILKEILIIIDLIPASIILRNAVSPTTEATTGIILDKDASPFNHHHVRMPRMVGPSVQIALQPDTLPGIAINRHVTTTTVYGVQRNFR